MSDYFLALFALASGREMPGAEPDSVIGQTLRPRPRSRFEPGEKTAASGEETVAEDTMFVPPRDIPPRAALSKALRWKEASPAPPSEGAGSKRASATVSDRGEATTAPPMDKPAGHEPAKVLPVAEAVERRPSKAVSEQMVEDVSRNEDDEVAAKGTAPPALEPAVADPAPEAVEASRAESGDASAGAPEGGPAPPTGMPAPEVRVSIGRIEVIVEAPPENPGASAPEPFPTPPPPAQPRAAPLAGTSGFDGYGARRRGRLR